MASLNRATLIGNIGKDPEIRSSQNGDRIASFSLAMTETWRDRNSGQRKERTEWARIVVFNDRIVEVVEKYLRKGSKVYVEGAIQSRDYTDRDGATRSVTEIVLSKFRGELVMLDSPSGGNREESRPQRKPNSEGGRYTGPASLAEDLDDSIPFATAAMDAEPCLAKARRTVL